MVDSWYCWAVCYFASTFVTMGADAVELDRLAVASDIRPVLTQRAEGATGLAGGQAFGAHADHSDLLSNPTDLILEVAAAHGVGAAALPLAIAYDY